MNHAPGSFDRDDEAFEPLEPLAEHLAAGVAVDWATADSSGLSDSQKELLLQLRAIAEIAGAHSSPVDGADAAADDGRVEPSAPQEAAPRAWGQLIIRSYLGRGSFGDVYRAWDPRLDREVALKLLATHADDESTRGSAVISEGRSLARVRHPNVVTVYGADRLGGRVGVWMEFVQGRTLSQRIAEDGPLAPAEAVAMGADLARALAAVHKAGLLHRDVKAQNVMCETGGRIVLTDFGTAVPHDERSSWSSVASQDGDAPDEAPEGLPTPVRNALAGTPLYLAPEVVEGGAQTPRSDVYALGVLLFYALSETFPIVGRTFREVKAGHREGRRSSLSDVRADVPDVLRAVVDRALETDAARRFQTADDMAAALDDAARQLNAGPVVATKPDATAVPATNTTIAARPRPWLFGGIAAGLVAALAIVAWLGGILPYRGIAKAQTVTGNNLVLVASFGNSTDDATLGQRIEQAVADGVARVRRFAIVSTERANTVRGYMRRAPDSPLDNAAAREAALRDGGIRAVVTGSIGGTSERPTVEVRVIVPSTGQSVATISEASFGGDLTKLLDAVRDGVAEALTDHQDALPAPTAEFERVTTASFEALRAFSNGRTVFEEGNRGSALSDFNRAIELDPDFAVAYTWAGWCTAGPAAAPLFEKGDELAQALSPEERLWARASHLIMAPANADAWRASAQANWELLQLDPLHYWALFNLDVVLRDNMREFPKVLPLWERQAAARPDDPKLQYRTGLAFLVVESQAHRAWPYLDRYLDLTKDSVEGVPVSYERAFARLAPAWDAWARGHASDAARIMASVCDAPTGGPKNQLAIHSDCLSLAAALGMLRRVDTHAAAVMAQPGRYAMAARAIPALLRGDRKTLQELYDATSSATLNALGIALRLGMSFDAGEHADENAWQGFTYRQVNDLLIGPSPETLRLFAERWRMVPLAVGGWFPEMGPQRIAVVYADALARTGDTERAVEVLRTAIPERRATITDHAPFGWITLMNGYGDLLRRLGRDAEAEPVQRELLDLLSEADEDHVIAAKLRARYGGTAPSDR